MWCTNREWQWSVVFNVLLWHYIAWFVCRQSFSSADIYQAVNPASPDRGIARQELGKMSSILIMKLLSGYSGLFDFLANQYANDIVGFKQNCTVQICSVLIFVNFAASVLNHQVSNQLIQSQPKLFTVNLTIVTHHTAILLILWRRRFDCACEGNTAQLTDHANRSVCGPA